MSSPTPPNSKNRGHRGRPDPNRPAHSGKYVLNVNENDNTDCDNISTRVVDQITITEIRKEPECQDAIKSHIRVEPKEVDPGMRRIQGKDIPLILLPICNALFKKLGLVETHRAGIEKYLQTKGENFDGLQEVLDKHQRNQSSVFIQAALNEKIIQTILNVIGFQKIIDKLREEKDKDGKDLERIPKILRAYPDVTIDEIWVQQQMRNCVRVRYETPEDLKKLNKASIRAGQLTCQPVRELLKVAGLLGKGDEMYLDTDALATLEAPLCHQMEHPDWLVDHKELTKACQTIMVTTPLTKKGRYKEMMKEMKKALNNDHQNRIKQGGYDETIQAGQGAEVILFFGGASMTCLEALACGARLASKIEFVGQGGTLNPRLNLTGNAFNFDLNPRAAYNVLTSHVGGNHRLRSFKLASTELCNHLLYDPNEVAALGGEGAQLLLNRIAAFGLDEYRINPEETILDPDNNAERLKSKGKGIKLPDLTAFFAAYSESFRTEYCKVYYPTYMFIIEKRSNGKVGAKRVRFSKTPQDQADVDLDEKTFSLDGSITLYLPQDGKAKEVDVKGLVKFLKECTIERMRMVKDALNSPQPGTNGTGSATAGRSRSGSTYKNGPTRPSSSSKTHTDDKPRRSRSKSRTPMSDNNGRHDSPSAHSDSPTAPTNDTHRSRSTSRQPKSRSQPAA